MSVFFLKAVFVISDVFIRVHHIAPSVRACAFLVVY